MTNYEFGEIVLVDFPRSGSVRGKRRPALVILDIGDCGYSVGSHNDKRAIWAR
ncbi:MAG: type II toxin-antitoxin system PemK/MazF family toxin [bacterium]